MEMAQCLLTFPVKVVLLPSWSSNSHRSSNTKRWNMFSWICSEDPPVLWFYHLVLSYQKYHQESSESSEPIYLHTTFMASGSSPISRKNQMDIRWAKSCWVQLCIGSKRRSNTSRFGGPRQSKQLDINTLTLPPSIPSWNDLPLCCSKRSRTSNVGWCLP